jgi:hypothetical protein
VSYSPSVFYDPLNADTAHMVLYADSEQEHREELARVFGDVFKELGQVEESEVDDARRKIRDFWDGDLAPPLADRMVLEVQRAAMDWILGHEYKSMDVGAAELSSVTAADVSAFGRDMQTTAMFALPGEADLRPLFGEQTPASTGLVVRGRRIRSVDAPIQRHRLVHGPDGVSVVSPDGTDNTVRYSDLAAAVFYNDGGVLLVGLDAAAVSVEPTLWRGGQRVCQEIREQVPEHLVVDQRSRPSDAIPKPTTTAWQRFWARLTLRGSSRVLSASLQGSSTHTGVGPVHCSTPMRQCSRMSSCGRCRSSVPAASEYTVEHPACTWAQEQVDC